MEAPALTLESLTHHRWAIPIIALLHQQRGAKFVFMVQRLQLSRDALSRSLQALTELGWVQRNPGYGHPLRPEYVLSVTGARLGPPCAELADWLTQHELTEPLLNKWSLPVLLGLQTQARFSALQRALPGSTARALTLSLTELTQRGLLQRSGREYHLTPLGLELVNLAARAHSALGPSDHDNQTNRPQGQQRPQALRET